MNKKQLSILAALVGVFLFAYFMNFASPKIQNAIMEAFYMLQWYVRYHTLACVVPAMFIAGAIATFFSKEAVLRHLGLKPTRSKRTVWHPLPAPYWRFVRAACCRCSPVFIEWEPDWVRPRPFSIQDRRST